MCSVKFKDSRLYVVLCDSTLLSLHYLMCLENGIGYKYQFKKNFKVDFVNSLLCYLLKHFLHLGLFRNYGFVTYTS